MLPPMMDFYKPATAVFSPAAKHLLPGEEAEEAGGALPLLELRHDGPVLLRLHQRLRHDEPAAGRDGHLNKTYHGEKLIQ